MEANPCSNCGHHLIAEQQFCPACGQKNAKKYVSFREILSDFFDSVFSLNSALLRTIRDLFVPARLTGKFFEGKRKSYYSPLRFFFITMIGFYTLIGFKYLGQLNDLAGLSPKEAIERENDLKALIDSADLRMTNQQLALSPSDSAVIDSFKTNLLRSFEAWRDTQSNGGIFLDAGKFDSIPREDFALLEADSIIRKYDIKGFWNILTLKQAQRTFKQPVDMLQFLIGNTTWMLIALIPFVALCMKLLYIRRKRYYIEHVVFLFHYHSLVFLTLILYFFFINILPEISVFFLLFFLLGFLWFALKKYYKNGFFKTTVKYGFLLIFYLFAFLFFIIGTSFISFLIFQ